MKNIVIAILVALLIVAGFMIAAKKKANVAYEPWPETEPATVTPTTPKPKPSASSVNSNVSINCNGVSGEKIKVLSPNGGEVFQMGQTITITWETCNAQTGQTVSLAIGRVVNSMGGTQPAVSFFPFQTSNDGHETVTLSSSSTNGNWPFVAGSNYIVSATLNPLPNNTHETPYINDSSDSHFTIQTSSTSSNLENIETPIYIKSVYQKNGKWWADVDYVTSVNARQYAEFRIDNGLCVIPGMTKQQMFDYARTVKILYGDPGTVEYEDSVFGDSLSGTGCFIDIYANEIGGYTINQNPLIRSFPFASNFRTVNGCNEQNNYLAQDYKTQVDNYRTYDSNGNLTNLNYSYGLFNTWGFYIRKVVIKNSEIEKFDYVNGCAG